MDFDSIYHSYYKELCHFACRQNQTNDEAADTLQDVFTALYKIMKSGRQVENPRAWLYHALLNSIRTQHRQKKAHNQRNAEYVSGNRLTTLSPFDDTEHEKKNLVEECLSKMEPKEKDLLLLYHKGFSYKEISEILRMNSNSVGTSIARATQKLTLLLKNQYHELFE